MDFFLGIVILLVVIVVWVLIMYWLINKFYKMLKPKIDRVTELKEKLDFLEARIKLLEEKSDNK